jgi:hypothetical protein
MPNEPEKIEYDGWEYWYIAPDHVIGSSLLEQGLVTWHHVPSTWLPPKPEDDETKSSRV